jgi:hypothetical protein
MPFINILLSFSTSTTSPLLIDLSPHATPEHNTTSATPTSQYAVRNLQEDSCDGLQSLSRLPGPEI